MRGINPHIKSQGADLRENAELYIEKLSEGNKAEQHPDMLATLGEINKACLELNHWLKNESTILLNQKKIVAVLGGDHSTPLGLMQALADINQSFGILHIDAHADLREAYEGFEFSHASIMFNALKIQQISHLVQVGIRDYCEAELKLIQSDKRISTFFDRDIKQQQFNGKNWAEICENIISLLPQNIYLSFDIDGLDPKLCPNTGTPVPGGLELEQALFLIERLVQSGRKIIGFDLNEVAPGSDEWDANVGARLLYRLANMCMVSND